MKFSRRQMLQISLLSLSGSVYKVAFGADKALADNHAYPGGIIELVWQKTSSETPIVKFGLEEPAIIHRGNYWHILIGLSLDTLPGDYVLYIKDPGSELPGTSLTFSVKQKLYPVSELEGELPRFNSLPEPISLLDFANSTPPKLPFRPPVEGEWETNFGRVFTNRRAAAITPSITQRFNSLSTDEIKMVVAPQSGIICRIDENSQNGSARIAIDHGRGVYTILDGVDDLSVEIGNGIVAGAAIGRLKPSNELTIQSDADLVDTLTRKTSNPYPRPGTLNWYCILNNAIVDPIILTQ